jgi:hypothetical protein
VVTTDVADLIITKKKIVGQSDDTAVSEVKKG